MKRQFNLVVCALLAATQMGCGDDDSTPVENEILLAAIIDRTGNNSQRSFDDSVSLAEQTMNEALEAEGKDLRFRIALEDSMNDPDRAIELAQRYAQEEGAKGIIIDSSRNSIEVNRLDYDDDDSNDLNVVRQCSGCTSGSINSPMIERDDPVEQATLRDADQWLFRTLMSTRLISKVMVQLIQERSENGDGDINGDGIFKLALYATDEAFGTSTQNAMESFAMELYPGEASNVAIEKMLFPADADPTGYDFATDLELLMDGNNETTGSADAEPDAVFVACFAQYYISLTRQYNTDGYEIPMLYVHTARFQSVIDGLGAQVNGVEGVSHILADGESGEIFRELFDAAYGNPISYRDSMYFDNAITMMLGALMASRGMDTPTDVTGRQIADMMPNLNSTSGTVVRPSIESLGEAIRLIDEGMPINYEGASGDMNYDDNGNVRSKLAHFRGEEQIFVDVTQYDCAASDDCPVID